MHFAPAPRHVPFSLRIINAFNVFGQVGWALFAFGSIFFWTFVMNADFSGLTMRGALQRAAARVTEVESTGASVNRQAVMANHYEFSVAGRLYRGVSYGSSAPTDVEVEFKDGDPETSRIVGMRRKMFGPGVAFVTIFPAIGFAIAFFAMRHGIKKNAILRDGLLASGTLVEKVPTNMTVNNQRVFELTFEFTTRNGQRAQAKTRTSQPSRLEDDAQEQLLYDPQKPEDAYLLDEAPAHPKVDGTGALVGHPIGAVLRLVLPAVAIALNALLAMWKL